MKSAARDFYLYMMQYGNESKDILTSRVKKICIDNNINMYKCLLESNYYSFVKKQCAVVQTSMKMDIH